MKEEISVKLETLEDAYSRFSTSNNRALDDELSSTIINMSKSVDRKSEIQLNMHIEGGCDDNDKAKLKKDIKNHFSREKNEIDVTIKRIVIIASLLFVFGAGLIAMLATISMGFVLYTIVEICSWVFLWECVDLICFQISINRLKLKNYNRLIKMEINFI